MTSLLPDVILTNTPSRVGAGMKPPQGRKAGDVTVLRFEGVGEQTQKVRPFEA